MELDAAPHDGPSGLGRRRGLRTGRRGALKARAHSRRPSCLRASSRRYVLDARRPGGEQISELVGNASAKVLADTYTHVLMDEREVDYASVIGERLGTPAESVLA